MDTRRTTRSSQNEKKTSLPQSSSSSSSSPFSSSSSSQICTRSKKRGGSYRSASEPLNERPEKRRRKRLSTDNITEKEKEKEEELEEEKTGKAKKEKKGEEGEKKRKKKGERKGESKGEKKSERKGEKKSEKKEKREKKGEKKGERKKEKKNMERSGNIPIPQATPPPSSSSFSNATPSPSSYTTSFEEMVASPNSMSRQRLNGLLEGLSDFGDETTQMICLQTICDYLSLGTEDNLGGFRVAPFCTAFATLLGHYNSEICILAARAVTHLLEALPNSTSNVVSAGVIPPLVASLQTIEFIDVAEQSLQALEKISQECGHDLLLCHGLSACLCYLEFFRVETQRTAMNTAANICRRATRDSWEFICGAIPYLHMLLTDFQRLDRGVVEKLCQCFAWLVERFSADADKIEEILPEVALSSITQLIAPPSSSSSSTPSPPSSSSSSSSLSPKTHTALLHMLTMASSISTSTTLSLFSCGICGILRRFLTFESKNVQGGKEGEGEGDGEGEGEGEVVSSFWSHPEQFLEILSLILVLLPPLPEEGKGGKEGGKEGKEGKEGGGVE